MSEAVRERLAADHYWPVSLPSFEGPLDLLLYLIRRNEIDIYDIPIETVTRDYLSALHKMENLPLEVAGEFFVMASTLMYIKSRMLLPAPVAAAEEEDSEEGGIDPRWELVQQLLQYKRVKEAAASLHECIRVQQDYVPRDFELPSDPDMKRELQPVDRLGIWNVYNQVLQQLRVRLQEGSIQDDSVTVSARIQHLLEGFSERQRQSFTELIALRPESMAYVVATFLALLELARLGELSVSQTELFAEIYCERTLRVAAVS